MNLCRNCIHNPDGVCAVYGKEPPSDGFAEKCKRFSERERQTEPEKPALQCESCERYDDGYCLRFDHPDYRYNFVKIREGNQCPLI